MVASSIIATGVDLPLDLLVFYDIPDNEVIVLQMLSKLFRSADIELAQQPAEICTFYDESKVLSSEISRYAKLQKTISSFVTEND
jgi:hypothetical protein